MLPIPITWVGGLGNIIIAVCYAGIAMWIVPKFDVATSVRSLRGIKLSATLFFMTCAISHADMAFHAFIGVSDSHDSWHYLLNTIVQAISTPAFIILVAQNLTIRIINKDEYGSMIDRRLLELEHAREEAVNRALMEAGDVASDVRRAMGDPVGSGTEAPR